MCNNVSNITSYEKNSSGEVLPMYLFRKASSAFIAVYRFEGEITNYLYVTGALQYHVVTTS